MKVFKKITSFLLAIVMIISVLSLNGCAKFSTSSIQFGEWIRMIDETFMMDTYNDSEPHIQGVSKDNQYFEYIQIASEWGVMTGLDSIDVNKDLLWKEAIITLVNTGEFLSEDATESEKIEYAIDNIDSQIRKYAINWEIPLSKAQDLLDASYNCFANKKYLTNVEEIEFKDGIIDFSGENNRIIDYEINDSYIVLPEEQAREISEGDIFVLPSNGKVLGTNAYKAISIKKENGKVYVEKSNEGIELTDVVENLHVQATYMPTTDNMILYDGNGDILDFNEDSTNNEALSIEGEPLVSPLGKVDQATRPLEVKKLSASFKVDDVTVSLSYSTGESFNLTCGVSGVLKKSESGNQSLTLSGEVGISDLEITQDVDIGFFKLKKAELKVDYTTKNSLSLKYSNKLEGRVAPYNNGNGGYLSNLKRSTLKKADAKGAKTIKLCSLDIYSVAVARVCLDVNLKVSFDGSITISITEHGSKGFEYKNGNIRQINVCDKDIDVSIKAKIEGTLAVGPALYVLGLKKKIVGFQITAGIGLEISIVMHVVDSQNHLLETCNADDISPEVYDMIANESIDLSPEAVKEIAESQGCTYDVETSNNKAHFDACFDVSAYFILRLEMADDSWLADLFGGKITFSYEIFGSKNAKFLNIHLEELDFNQLSNIKFGKAANETQCTKKFTPFEEKKRDEDSTETTRKDDFGIDAYSLNVEVGGTGQISISNLPSNYSMSDVSFASADESIATVTSDGKVTGIKNGTTSITVNTKDKKYSYECVVFVE